jgi:hypothetical protein
MTDLLLKFETLALLVLQTDLLYLYAFEGLDSPSAPSGRFLMYPEPLPRRPDEIKDGVANIGGLLCGLTVAVGRKIRVNVNVNEGCVLRSGSGIV